MPIDPTLITNWAAQQAQLNDPLVRAAKLQALQSGVQQQQVNALDLQQKRQQIADQQALDTAMAGGITRDPTTGAVTYDKNKVLGALPGHMLPGVSKTFSDMDEAAAKLQKAKADGIAATNELAGSAALGVKDAGYSPTALQAALVHGTGTGAFTPQQSAQIFQQAGGANATPQSIQAVIDPFLNTPGIQEILAKRGTVAAETAKATAATSEAATAAAKAQREKDQDFLNQISGTTNQQDYGAMVRSGAASGVSPSVISRLPAGWSPEGVKTIAAQAMSAKDRQEAADRAAAEAQRAKAEADAEADRKVSQGQRAQGLGIEGAKLALEQRRLQNEQATQGAFAGMAPQERARAETAYSKDTKDYTDAVAAARGVQNLIAQAQGGNKAAPGLVSIAELRQYLNRINATELKAVGTGAGSALDRFEGWVKGATEGQPIPPEVLRDMTTVSQVQEKLAYQKYLARLATNKVSYGVQPPPIDVSGIYGPAPGTAQPAAPAAAQVRIPGVPPGAKVRHSASNPNIVQFSTDGGQTWQAPRQ